MRRWVGLIKREEWKSMLLWRMELWSEQPDPSVKLECKGGCACVRACVCVRPLKLNDNAQ